MTDANGHTTHYAYDSRNRLTTVTDGLGHTTVYGYDSGGNQQTVKDALGDVTTTLYDADNRATTIVDPRGRHDHDGLRRGRAHDRTNRSEWQPYDLELRRGRPHDDHDRSARATRQLMCTTNDDQLTDTTDRDSRR